MPIRFAEIVYDSPEYKEELALRNRILRVPLGLSVYDEDLSKEAAYRHFGLYRDDIFVACLIAVPGEGEIVQLRAMAVDEESQGQGFGKRILSEVVRLLTEEGVLELWLNARDSAVGFYEKLGFEARGEYFHTVSIPHVKMTKKLG